ncbi:BTAD domain-containing putative transcriptional regulator [Anaeromyxobacter sp. Fw109-5]|uniref:ATP-binding protein n=1 Tax=Anaeromyxobacter sp. (strain Fw109-5) TaxID=404589 RepID=UPI0002EB79DD|nr:BTAD domain-containing putative transcriptional regulator [Anaeromyxobacter sp. Fw109-5]
MLKLHLLGRFEVVRADTPIPAHAWRRRRPADLLKLVALAPGRTLGREAAIDALWPDKDPASGANNLHRALYDLRQILGGRWVDIEHGLLSLRPDVWVDVDVFEAAARADGSERWGQAVALYRGDLSPEDRDSPWLQPRRAELRARFVDVALPLARSTADRGDFSTAIPNLRRVLEADPANEEAHRLLMRLLAETGRRAEALRQYDACEEALRVAGRPGASEETRALWDAIQRGAVGPPQAPPAQDAARRASRRLLGTTEPAPVRGRGAVTLLLESLLEQGSGTLVLLGERGVGKTRLAVEGARLAQARGAAVLCGVATGRGAPYALLADAFAEEARANPAFGDPLAGAAPGSGVAGEDVRQGIFDAVEQALRAASGGRPLYLLLDDLHAADESSLNLLHLLARDARALRLMIVGTCNEAAVHSGTPIQMALAHLDCARLARGVRLPRLGLAATREQVADLLGEPAAESTVTQLYRLADGSPLLTEELVRAQRESSTSTLPASLPAAIHARVERLGARAEALLAAAAVAGARFDFELVHPVSGLTPHEAISALDACVEARLLDEDGAGYRFHHALVRDALYEGLPPARRAALHGALADALEAVVPPGGEPPSEALAWHRRRAGDDERAVVHLIAAGHRAAARAGLGEALAFYSEALELLERTGGPTATQELELRDAMGRVQLDLGELAGAARSFSQAARAEDGANPSLAPEQRARAHRLAAVSLAAAGQLRAAAGELEEGLAAVEAMGEEAAALLHLRAQLLWHEHRPAEALAAAEACLVRAQEAADADLAARGADLVALARASLGDPLRPPEDATGPRERAQQDLTPEHPVPLHLVLWDRDLLGDATAAEVGHAAALLSQRARQREAVRAAVSGRYGEGVAALAAGELDLAEVALRDALERHRATGSAIGEALALERLAALLTVRGRLDEALSLVDLGVVVAERARLRRHALTRLHATEARNRLAAGALYAAEDAVREASEAAARHGPCAACDAAFRPEAVRVWLARGRLGHADAEATQLEELARQRGGRVVFAIARLARARVLAAHGRVDEALAALANARAGFLGAGHRLDAARTVRFEARLRGAGWTIPEELLALDALAILDADA